MPKGAPLPLTGDLDQFCRTELDRQIRRAATRRHLLKIPTPRGLMRQGEGRHFHFTPELFIQLSGCADFNFPYEHFRLFENELCILPVGLPHKEAARPWRGPFRHIVFMFTANTVAWHLKEGHTPGLKPRWVHPTRSIITHEAQRAIGYMVELGEAFHAASPTREAMLHGLLLAYLALLRKLLEPGQPTLSKCSHKIAQCQHEVLRRLANPSLSVQMLAGILQCSPNYLSSLFHRETGKTLIAFIQHERMLQAQAMLENSMSSAKEVSWAVGIPDQSYFTRIFRQLIGLTPKQYQLHSAQKGGPNLKQFQDSGEM